MAPPGSADGGVMTDTETTITSDPTDDDVAALVDAHLAVPSFEL